MSDADKVQTSEFDPFAGPFNANKSSVPAPVVASPPAPVTAGTVTPFQVRVLMVGGGPEPLLSLVITPTTIAPLVSVPMLKV